MVVSFALFGRPSAEWRRPALDQAAPVLEACTLRDWQGLPFPRSQSHTQSHVTRAIQGACGNAWEPLHRSKMLQGGTGGLLTGGRRSDGGALGPEPSLTFDLELSEQRQLRVEARAASLSLSAFCGSVRGWQRRLATPASCQFARTGCGPGCFESPYQRSELLCAQSRTESHRV